MSEYRVRLRELHERMEHTGLTDAEQAEMASELRAVATKYPEGSRSRSIMEQAVVDRYKEISRNRLDETTKIEVAGKKVDERELVELMDREEKPVANQQYKNKVKTIVVNPRRYVRIWGDENSQTRIMKLATVYSNTHKVVWTDVDGNTVLLSIRELKKALKEAISIQQRLRTTYLQQVKAKPAKIKKVSVKLLISKAFDKLVDTIVKKIVG